MTDDRDRRRPPAHDTLAGPETVDPQEITDRFSMLEATPQIQAAFVRLARSTEETRTALAANNARDREEILARVKTLHERTHELANAIATSNTTIEAHIQVDDVRISNLERDMVEQSARTSVLVGKVEAKVESRESSTTKWLIAFLTIALGIGGAVLAQWITMSQRVQHVEDRIDSAKDASDQTNRALDRLDSRVDAIGVRLGVPQPAGSDK